MLLGWSKSVLRSVVPAPARSLARRAIQFPQRLREEVPLLLFECKPIRATTYFQRRTLTAGMRLAHRNIRCPHKHSEIVAMLEFILSIPSQVEGCIVEAGCFKGGSTAKLSLGAKRCGREMLVFDSFAGIPEHKEVHGTTLLGEPAEVAKGQYCGQLEEVRQNVQSFGAVDVCTFVPGWFEDTLPQLKRPVVMAFVDVDLAASTKTCIQYLYPLLVPGGAIFSHDGHRPLCIAAISDDRFWTEVVGYRRPEIPGLGRRKLLRISKPS